MILQTFPEPENEREPNITRKYYILCDRSNSGNKIEAARYCLYTYNDEPKIVYLSHLYVNPQYRSRGLGRTVINLIKDEVFEYRRAEELRLWVNKDSWVHGWYKRAGFKDMEGETDNSYIRPDDVWMFMPNPYNDKD